MTAKEGLHNLMRSACWSDEEPCCLEGTASEPWSSALRTDLFLGSIGL